MEPSYELIAHVISIVSPINFIVCIYVILVNSLVIWGYIRVENKTPVTFLFVALGMADISIAANYALRSVLSWFCLCGQELPTIATSVFLAAGLCSYNISNLLHVTLAVVKCVNIRFPFFQIRFERVKQVMIAAAVLWALLSAVDLALYLSFQNYGPLSSSCQHPCCQQRALNFLERCGMKLPSSKKKQNDKIAKKVKSTKKRPNPNVVDASPPSSKRKKVKEGGKAFN